MPKNKRILLLFVASFFLIFSVTSSFALAEEKPEISKTKQNSIVKHCDSIKESLKATQKSDAHARTYLGSIYETIVNRFVTPLNIRLLKNNSSDLELTNLQTDLVDTRSDFNASFISYSKSLEELINMDCKTSPKEFYSKLEETRKGRKAVDNYTKQMEKLISTHKQKVSKLEKSL